MTGSWVLNYTPAAIVITSSPSCPSISGTYREIGQGTRGMSPGSSRFCRESIQVQAEWWVIPADTHVSLSSRQNTAIGSGPSDAPWRSERYRGGAKRACGQPGAVTRPRWLCARWGLEPEYRTLSLLGAGVSTDRKQVRGREDAQGGGASVEGCGSEPRRQAAVQSPDAAGRLVGGGSVDSGAGHWVSLTVGLRCSPAAPLRPRHPPYPPTPTSLQKPEVGPKVIIWEGLSSASAS